MKTIHGIWLCLFLASPGFGQETYYYGNGRQIPLLISERSISIKFSPSATPTEIDGFLSSDPDLGSLIMLSSPDCRKVTLKRPVNIQGLMTRLRSNSMIEKVNPAYILNNTEMLTSDLFRVRFKPSVGRPEIDRMNAAFGTEIMEEVQGRPEVYTLRVVHPSLTTLDVANTYYEDERTEWAVPEFFHNWELFGNPNDTYFSNQWYLHNTGQVGVADVDIDAPEAWDISLGNSSIVVAVIDGGVSTGQVPQHPVHEDLPVSRLVVLPGSDFYGNNGQQADDDPSPEGNEGHGMAVAGIIAANHNNGKGIAGVAPNCKIMPIRRSGARVFDNSLDAFQVAGTIDFASTRNADIISNSWNGGAEGYWNEDIADAITTAMTNGRNGKGCVVVFSAGNTANRNGSPPFVGFVQFPATVPGVISVGAIDRFGNIQYYSPHGNDIDVVAPSGSLASIGAGSCSGQRYLHWTLAHGFWTLDIPGIVGYNDGQQGYCPPTIYDRYSVSGGPSGDDPAVGHYTSGFGGTSAACPQVAGVAALLLSLNSNFTRQQVYDFITQSADLAQGQSTLDFGHGRLNAHQALLLALPSAMPITSAPVQNTHWCVNTQKTIIWNGNPGTSYTIKVSTDNGATFPTTIATNVTSTSSTFSYNWTVSVGPAPNCKLVIIDNNTSVLRDTSDTFVIDGTTAPTVPASFNLTAQNTHPYLTWVADGTAAGYEIWRASSQVGYTWYKIQTINNPNANSYLDEIVTIGQSNPYTMSYKVRAFNGCNVLSNYTFPKWISYAEFIKSIASGEVETAKLPTEFALKQNYPNPFNPSTTIEYDVPRESNVRILLYDELGREVVELVNSVHQPGVHRITFDASGLASGVYFYRLSAGIFTQSRKLLFVK